MPSSTTRPSTWWNIGVCVASESRRYTLPRQTTYTGGCCCSMTRTWTGEVWVRSSTPRSASTTASGMVSRCSTTQKVSWAERAGWLGGVLSAVKL